jgi:uncharacterized membrane protein
MAFAPVGRSYPAPPIAANPYAAPPSPADPMARRAAEREERAAAAKRIAIVTYVLNFLAFLYFVPGIVALVVAYIKRGDARGTWVESHFDWQIATFWMGLWWVIGTVTIGTAAAIMMDAFELVIILVYPVAFAIFIWYVYRLVRGALALNDNKPIG